MIQCNLFDQKLYKKYKLLLLLFVLNMITKYINKILKIISKTVMKTFFFNKDKK